MTHTAHDHDHHPGLDGQAEILDLDAEVLAEHTASIIEWLPLQASPRQIVDLGCGTGAGTFALLAHFPEAHVTAVDSSVEHLHRLHEKACRNGVADRVRTVQADLDATWPDLGEPDLVWASASLHHMADPDRTLRRVRDILAPGGLFAVVELAGFPRFLPDGAPEDRPGLEGRVHAASDRHHAEHVPHRGADWGPKLTAAGFTSDGERTVTVDVAQSRSESVARYALSGLRRMRHAVADALPADDLTALDQLLDTDSPHSILRRDDLAVRTERTVWAARRDHEGHPSPVAAAGGAGRAGRAEGSRPARECGSAAFRMPERSPPGSRRWPGDQEPAARTRSISSISARLGRAPTSDVTTCPFL